MVLISYWDSVICAEIPGDEVASRTDGVLTCIARNVQCNELNERCMARMKLDLDDLRGFVAIAELSSFHAAADSLNAPWGIRELAWEAADELTAELECSRRYVLLEAAARVEESSWPMEVGK